MKPPTPRQAPPRPFFQPVWLLACLLLGNLAACAAATPSAPPTATPTAPATSAKSNPFAKWEKEITAMEAADRTNPPPQGAVLFIGSSTIRLWKSLAQDFPRHAVINRGFGGSEIADATHFAPRVIFPCKPAVIFLRSGGNDIHNGKSPEQVFADYLAFVATIRQRLPQTEIIYIGLAPTLARLSEVPDGNRLNALIQDHVRSHRGLKFVDCADMTLGPDGLPRAELFVTDKLHFNDAGYRLLAERVRPFLPQSP